MKLMEQGQIGNLTIKNRVVMAAMGIRGLADPDGNWGSRVEAFYEARAKGGVGLITTEMAFVTTELEPVSKQLFRFESDKHMASLSKIASNIHSYGGKISVQLTAGFGRVIPVPIIDDDIPPVSASVNTNFYFPDWEDYNTRAMTTEETRSLGQAFGYAAKRCREAGADCVELHGHEGYLLDQFMTALWNQRTDSYGGSRENRFRLIREAIQAIQRDAGEDFPIIFRFGITHYLEGGREEEEGFWIAQKLENLGVSALHIDAGCYETSWWPHPPSYQPPGCMVHLAEKVKNRCSLPVIAVGRLHYPDVAETSLVEGKADFVAIGRGLLAEPEWVNKVQNDRVGEIAPCTGCHEGCLWQMIAGEPTSCAVNPHCGHETDRPITPLAKKRSLLIIGAGPAGVEAARIGMLRGFDVTVWEATQRIGGSLWPASKADFKHDILRYIRYLENLTNRLGVSIKFNKRASVEQINDFGADYTVIATGAAMEPLPFRGDNIHSAIDVLNGTLPPGDEILIMGGGVIGCETGLYLANHAKQVTICAREDSDYLDMASFYDHNNRTMLLNLLRDNSHIKIHRGAIPVAVENGCAIVEQEDSKIQIPMDSLVFSGRLFSQNEIYQSFENNDHVFSIGDCDEPGRIMDAVWKAFETIRTIEVPGDSNAT